MKNIGLMGGCTTFRLGNQSDVKLFFVVLRQLPKLMNDPDIKYLFMDRLYRRYIKEDELELFVSKSKEIKNVFSLLSLSDVDLGAFSKQNITLELGKDNLAEVFHLFFKGIVRVSESAEDVREDWGKYFPVKLCSSDIPLYDIDKNRDDVEYDNLTDLNTPFWLRE